MLRCENSAPAGFAVFEWEIWMGNEGKRLRSDLDVMHTPQQDGPNATRLRVIPGAAPEAHCSASLLAPVIDVTIGRSGR